MKKVILTQIAIICFISYSAYGRTIKEIIPYENRIYKFFSLGDDYRFYHSVEKLVKEKPMHPITSLYFSDLTSLVDIHGVKRVETVLLSAIKDVKSKNDKNKNSILLSLTLNLEKLYKSYNLEKVNSISKKLHPLRKWILIGPYSKYGKGDMFYPYMPEFITDYNRFGKKLKKIDEVSADGSVSISKYLFPETGIAYAVASFRIKGSAKIRIYSDSFYSLYINGKEVIKNFHKRYGNTRIVRIWGTEKVTLMLKIYSNRDWKFRVFLTDDHDKVMRPSVVLNKTFIDDFQYRELNDFPYDYLVNAKDKKRAYAYLGSYYRELNNPEAIKWFRKSLQLWDNSVVKFLFAITLIESSKGRKSSAKYLEGWRILDNLGKSDPAFIPVAYKRIQRDASGKDHIKAIKRARRIISKAPNYLFTYIDLLNLYYSNKLHGEFFQYLNLFKKKFPESKYPLMMEAQYYKSRNISVYIEKEKSILSKIYSRNVVKNLLYTYIATGKYKEAEALVSRYNKFNDFFQDKIDLSLKKNDLDEAKRNIFAETVNRNLPSLYFKLGLIDSYRGIDPSMHWKRMLLINPSSFNIADYMIFLRDKKIENPFKKYIKNSTTGSEIAAFFRKYKNSEYPATCIKRQRVFRLYSDGNSRVYCDDLIYIRDQKGVDLWGDIKIPFEGDMFPVSIKVYHENGNVYDSYGIYKVDYNNYVNINSLKQKTILHLSYIVENPIKDPVHSRLFSLPYTLLQKYDEPVSYLSYKVIAPGSMKLAFYGNHQVVISEDDDTKIYSYNLNNLPAVKEEQFSGSDFECLPVFSFSTVTSINDLVLWYNGLIAGLDRIDIPINTNKFKSSSIEGTVKNVYTFVSRHLELQQNILYLPGSAEDTFYNKRGTPEDKVILTKSLLQKLGIESYISFVEKRGIRTGNFISSDMFSGILLYVPLKKTTGVWLDFTGKYYPFGLIGYKYENKTATLFLNNGFVKKRVYSRFQNNISNLFNVNINSKGDADYSIKTVFRGHYSTVRKYFNEENSHEDIIYSYYGRKLRSFDIRKYSIENLENFDKNLIMTVKGKSPNEAFIGIDTVTFKPIVNKSSIYRYIRNQSRIHPLVIMYPVSEHDEYTYILPIKNHKEIIDKTFHFQCKYGKAKFVFKKGRESNILRITKDINILPSTINLRDYKEFVTFCLNVKKIEFSNVAMKKN